MRKLRFKPFALVFPVLSAAALAGCDMMETASTFEDAQSAFNQREYRIANAHIVDLIANDRADHRVRRLQVELMLAMGDGNRAIVAIDQLPESELGGSERRIAIAHAQNLSGDASKTAKKYEPLAAEEYTEQDLRMLLWALRDMGDIETFADGMDAALDLFPDSAHLNALAADQLFDMGIPEEAAEFAARALKNGPEIYEAQLVSGRAMIFAGNLEDALEHYKKANAINPARALPLANIIGLHLDMGNTDAAGETLEPALARHADAPMLQWQLARHKLATGDIAGARYAKERARREFRDDPQFMLLVGDIEAAAGNSTLALDSYRRFIREVGEVPEVMERIAKLDG